MVARIFSAISGHVKKPISPAAAIQVLRADWLIVSVGQQLRPNRIVTCAVSKVGEGCKPLGVLPSSVKLNIGVE